MKQTAGNPHTVTHLVERGFLEGTLMEGLPPGVLSHLSIRENLMMCRYTLRPEVTIGLRVNCLGDLWDDVSGRTSGKVFSKGLGVPCNSPVTHPSTLIYLYSPYNSAEVFSSCCVVLKGRRWVR